MAGVPFIFGNATTSIPLSNLDANFNTGLTIGNTTVGLGNTVTTLGNVTLNNATVSSTAIALPYASLPTGSVLQVVSTNYSGNAGTTSTTPVDLGSLTLSITPKFATSKIQLTWTVAGVCTGNNNSTTYQTIIFVADASNNVVCRISDASVPGGASTNPMAYYSGTFQVSPATTSALTYKIRWYSPTSASIQMNNYITNSGTMSNITAMEIAA